jgi:membrane dipeptidase
MTRFFDAHCDTVMRRSESGDDFVHGGSLAHADLPRMLGAGLFAQLFAVFAPASYYPDRDLRLYAEETIAVIHGWERASDGRFRIARSARDLAAAFTAGDHLAGLIGLEGADPLDGRAENLAHFYDLGVRLVIPAWDDSPFGGGATGSGGPLTSEGAELLIRAEQLGVMFDVSHLSDRAFEQLCSLATRPFIASHSDCRALSSAPRNLTDAQIRAIAERGGAVGINLAPDFLAPDYLVAWDAVMATAHQIASTGLEPGATASAVRQRMREAAGDRLRAIPLPGIEWVARHVRHLIAVGGEDLPGLGGDLDGISFMPAGVTGVESYPAIADALRAAGLTERQVDKVCYGNMLRVFSDVID